MPKIVSNTAVDNKDGEWWGTFVTKGIAWDNGGRVTVQKKLFVRFMAPPNTAIELNASLNPWQQVSYTTGAKALDSKNVQITAEVTITGPYTFNTSDTLTWGVGADLRGDMSAYTRSFEVFADQLPAGGGIKPPGSGIPKSGSPAQGGANPKTPSLSVAVGQLPPPLDKEQLRIQVATGNKIWKVFYSPANQATSLSGSPSSGTATVAAELTVNNVKYTNSQSVKLSNTPAKVTIDNKNITQANINTTSFANLTLNITTDIQPSSDTISFRLVSADRSAFLYRKEIPIKTGAVALGIPVAPGRYKIDAAGIIKNGILYGTQVAREITVPPSGSGSSTKLDLQILRGPNLLVRGFPHHLSFGAISDLADQEGKDLTAARVTSVFKYAGHDGAGDAGAYLADDPATTQTVQLAARVSAKTNQPVLPIMVSYTVNLSLGNSNALLQNAQGQEHSLGNLILSLQLARKHSTGKVPAGFVINPDFLGDNQQAGRTASYVMPVVEPLTRALAHRGVRATVPPSITNTLRGYVMAINWLIRTVAPDATFGWVVNLWGAGSSLWAYNNNHSTPSAATEITNAARQTVTYIQSLGAYQGASVPDFLAIDRYEGDDFTQRAYANGYCYGPNEWRNYYDFVKTVALLLKVPVMPWQVPASRVPNARDSSGASVASLERDHWGTGGTYLFGDAAIGSSAENIHPAVLGIRPVGIPTLQGTDGDVRGLFARAGAFDWGYPAHDDFPLRGIFTVLLGGGDTTGVLATIGTTGRWTQEKVGRYMAAPVSLVGTPKTRSVPRVLSA